MIMGGGTGSRSTSIGNLKNLLEKAKEELKKVESEGKRNVFISFAYDDIDTVNLLRAHAKNDGSPIEFNDWSVSEPINSERAPYIKQKIIERIDRASATVVFMSDNTPNSDWVKWEINASLQRGKHVIGVYPKDKKPKSFPEEVRTNNIKCVAWPELSSAISGLN